MSLRLNSSGGGYVEQDAPNIAGNYTLTLPTSAGSAGQYLRNSGTAGTLEFGDLSVTNPAVLQVRTTFKTNATSYLSTASSFGDLSGLSVSITPASASNKILVVARVSVSAAANYRVALGLKRGGSVITAANNQQTGIGNRTPAHSSTSIPSSGNNMADLLVTYLDSPATTSSTTYQITGSGEGNSTIYVNQSQSNGDSDAVYLSTSFVSVFELDGSLVS